MRRGAAGVVRAWRERRAADRQRSSGRRVPSSATTRATSRCCWRPRWKAPPRDVAERIGDGAPRGMGEALDRAEVAGPGFVNLFLSDRVVPCRPERHPGCWRAFGARRRPGGRRASACCVEFVSANPTGPADGGGRASRSLRGLPRPRARFAGHRVEREYYVNDHGTPDRAVRGLDRRRDDGSGASRGADTRASTWASSPRALAGRGPEAGRSRRALPPRASS